MCASAVRLAISTSPRLFAYSRCRTCPGWTMSNVPWHMMTFRSRGGGPMISATSRAVLILWLTSRRLASSIDVRLLRLGQRLEPAGGRLGDRIRVPERRVSPVIDFGDDPAHAFVEAHRRSPAEIALNTGNVGVGAIRFAGALGDVHRGAAEQLHQPVDRLRIPRSDVPHPAGQIRFAGGEERPRQVGGIDEVPRLRAVA